MKAQMAGSCYNQVTEHKQYDGSVGVEYVGLGDL